MKYNCKGICHNLEGYEKGNYHFVTQHKKWCSSCNYKIPLKSNGNSRFCPCCKITYRKTSLANTRKKKIQIDMKIKTAIVALYQKQI